MKQNSEDTKKVAFFYKKRLFLGSICLLIILLHSQLSILLDKVFQQEFSTTQSDSLTGLLLVLCIGALLRYHQAARASSAWSKVVNGFTPYKKRTLGARKILLEETQEGESEYDDSDWYHLDEYDYQYILQEETLFKTISVKKYAGPDTGVKGIEKMKLRVIVGYCKLKALIIFMIHEPEILDIVWPYIFAVIAILELAGPLKISIFLRNFGHTISSF